MSEFQFCCSVNDLTAVGFICRITIKYFLSFQRMDLGQCPSVHDLALRADYEAAAKNKDYYYDIDVSVFKLFVYDKALLFHFFS